MNSQAIPDSAVEAASLLVWGGINEHRAQVMRAALEAAAPFMPNETRCNFGVV